MWTLKEKKFRKGDIAMDKVEYCIAITILALSIVLVCAQPISKEKSVKRAMNDYICQKAVMQVER
jgi:hypothetical protein